VGLLRPQMSEREFGVERPSQTGPGLASSPDSAPGPAWELHRKRKRSDSPYKGTTELHLAAEKASWGLTVPLLSSHQRRGMQSLCSSEQ
jgi:hypothetical protein